MASTSCRSSPAARACSGWPLAARCSSERGADVPRRFLTAEDVRRANAAEIVVEEGTVVTPQALEVAEAAGITIRSGAGSWKEPPPDRGPDAETMPQRLPHLPEPHDNPSLESTAI